MTLEPSTARTADIEPRSAGFANAPSAESRPPARSTSSAPHAALRRTELLLIVTFWTFLALLTALNAVLDPRPRSIDAQLPWRSVGYAFLQYYLWALLTPLLFWLASRYSLEQPDRLQRLLLFLALGAVIAVGMEAALSWLRVEFFLERPPRGPFGPRGGRGGPLFGVRRLFWLDDLMVFIAVMAAGMARDYFWRYRARLEEGVRLQARAAELQAQLARAHLAALRSQLDPHFLFNTLHAVSSLVERDPRGVRRMIARLSELLRSTLDVAQEPETTLEQELEFLRRYIEIMEIRFQGRLHVTMRIAPEALDALVPTLILQPLVENAVKHGVGKVDGVGRIAVSADRDGERVRLEVRDNGPGPQARQDETEEGVGLRNTRARLAQLYGDAQHLTLSDAPDGGAVVAVTLPYHRRGDVRTAVEAPPGDAT